ncbi:hypothetical protein BpHYR1_053234 [Brachionus plicatilis]|uniref:Uncharacterized protein n=1 Tax=Brachionus plicatilis TaxID=10195 RepID=A0A3M7SHG3_BRAPC|nr:hypothetical protein BpHYR1_053234 [Brachionus plicatilis]
MNKTLGKCKSIKKISRNFFLYAVIITIYKSYCKTSLRRFSIEKAKKKYFFLVDSGLDKILVSCFYRPPHSSKEISIQINKIFGDFNYPKIVWSNLGGICSASFVQNLEFLENLQENFLHQMLLEPSFKNNILDLVITNDSNIIYNVNTGPPLGSSVKNILHNILTWEFSVHNTTKELTRACSSNSSIKNVTFQNLVKSWITMVGKMSSQI